MVQAKDLRVVRMDEGEGDPVQRFDVATMGRVRKTQQGFLEVDATITKTGIFEYRRADGTMRRELRLAEDVFAPGSMATLRYAPVTDMHKGGMVNPGNVKDLQIGMTVGDARRHGGKLKSELLIQDQQAIANVMSGQRREISAGYTCRCDETPGTHQGKKYDAIQRQIIFNHVAIGPRDWARAGNDAQIHLDGLDAFAEVAHEDATPLFTFIQKQIDTLSIDQLELAKRSRIDGVRLLEIMQGFDPPSADELQALAEALETPVQELRKLVPVLDAKKTTPEPLPMKKITIKLDGISYEIELPEALASNFQQQIGRLYDVGEKATGMVTELKEKLDASEKDLKKAKDRLDEVEAPKFIEDRIKARVDLCDRAHKVLGADAKLDGLEDMAIIKKALEVHDKDLRQDGKGDDELRGIFNYVTDKIEAKPKTNLDGVLPHLRTPPKDGEDDKRTPKEKMDERNKAAGTGALLYSKEKMAS